MYVLGDCASVSTILTLDLGTFSTVWYLFVFPFIPTIYYMLFVLCTEEVMVYQRWSFKRSYTQYGRQVLCALLCTLLVTRLVSLVA
jgi:hypothetical protein